MKTIYWDSFDDWLTSTDSGFYFFVSPVFSTDIKSFLKSSVISTISPVLSVFVQFRSSDSSFDQNNILIPWTQLSSQNLDGVDLFLSDMGHFVSGQFFQLRIKSSSSNPVSSVFVIAESSELLRTFTGKSCYNNGVVLGQEIELSEQKELSKINLNLHVSKINDNYFHPIENVICFSCLNFQYSTFSFDWSKTIEAISDPIPLQQGFLRKKLINQQDNSQYSSSDVLETNDYLRYDFIIDAPGVYDVYIKAVTTSKFSFYIKLDDAQFLNILPLPESTTLDPVSWIKIGRYNFEGISTHSLYIYNGNDSYKILDSIYITSNLSSPPLDNEIQIKSFGPFNSFLYISTIIGSQTLSSEASSSRHIVQAGTSEEFEEGEGVSSYGFASNWISSINIGRSGLYGYDMNNTVLTQGLYRIQFMQVGGDSNNFVGWDYTESSSVIGSSGISLDYGQSFSDL